MVTVDTSKFTVTIDSGRPFHPSLIHREDDDPITLAILIDLTRSKDDLLPALPGAIATLGLQALRPQDRVSVYAVSCNLVRFLVNAPADPTHLKAAVDSALDSPLLYASGTSNTACAQNLHLWDAIAYINKELSNLPGHRVILAFTAGHDNGSRLTWKQAQQDADSKGIAVFGLSQRAKFIFGSQNSVEASFRLLCQLTGGLDRLTSASELPDSLYLFLYMLRTRYIIEFPRPDNLSRGPHSIGVKLAKTHAFVRPSGLTVPIADPELLADPTTIHSDPMKAPDVGSRHILSPNQ